MASAESAYPPLSIGWLMDFYAAQVTPTKGTSKRAHDGRARRVFIDYFSWRAGLGEVERGPARPAMSLDPTDWKGFVRARSDGAIPGWPTKCRANQVRLDLTYLVGVLNWASGAEPGEAHHIPRNPWRAERRRATGMRRPKEKDPLQPGLSDAEFRALLLHSPNWRFTVVAILCRETLHRMSSVRQVRHEHIDLVRGVIRWERSTDKNRRGLVSCLSQAAVAAIRAAPKVEGSPYLVPAITNPDSPCPRGTLEDWLRRAKEKAGIVEVWTGFHSVRRSGIRTEPFRELPPIVQEELTGTSYAMLKQTYDRVTLRQLREASLKVAGAERTE